MARSGKARPAARALRSRRVSSTPTPTPRPRKRLHSQTRPSPSSPPIGPDPTAPPLTPPGFRSPASSTLPSPGSASSVLSPPSSLLSPLSLASVQQKDTSTVHTSAAMPQTGAILPKPKAKQKQSRNGDTKIYYQGYEFTRRKSTTKKIRFTCSFYRKPTWCPGVLMYNADTMTYDYANMVPHTCRPPNTHDHPRAPEDSACKFLHAQMKQFVDELEPTGLSGIKIWEMASEKFYMFTPDGAVRGLSKKEVTTRVQNARSSQRGKNIFSQLECPKLCKVSNADLGFLQFNYTWYDDKKAKLASKTANARAVSGLERVIGWAHPHLSVLLKNNSLDVFVDGTFRCRPKPFEQCVTLMIYDSMTHLYVPVFFALTTSRTESSYLRLLQCIDFAVGKKPDCSTVVCDFESALILAVRKHFPDVRIIGCLFHLKQAWRRKLKKYRFSNAEAGIAMDFGVMDSLTVINPDKVAVEGVAWVKAKIRSCCKAKNISYSQPKWRRFWSYFERIWVKKFPPELWNIFGMRREIVSRTNNPLERYHRELNARFPVPHPALDRFVRTIEELARSYVIARQSILAAEASPPERTKMTFPRAPTLPSKADIKNSDTESEIESDSSSTTSEHGQNAVDINVSDHSDAQVDEADQGPPQYDASFDYEGEEKSDVVCT